MTEKFNSGDDFNAISALMRAEVQNARRALDRIADDPILGVHEARKAIKKVRSNARLIRKGDKTASRRINAAGRRAANILEEARDADSLEQIARAASMKCEHAGLARALREEADRAREDSLRVRRDEAADQCRTALDALESEIGQLEPFDKPRKAMLNGLARTWKRAVKRLEDARDEPDAYRLHELRKRVKDWRYHITVCKRVWPDTLERQKSETKALADILGDHHDLSRLIARLDDRAGACEARAIDELEEAQERLCERALDAAGDVFDLSPSKARKRLLDSL